MREASSLPPTAASGSPVAGLVTKMGWADQVTLIAGLPALPPV
ncbi:hypothetical protein MA4S0726RB_2959 [Mycobacteroides abscessus 4S-0726-RB]|nr:hypothetical protein MA4S0726RB_2959 [Mycobacteroides abscessus 4S-0726-RB]